MFRAALEQLLYDQGFQRGMLAQQIEDLEKAIDDYTAPSWALALDTEYLTVIKDLGNGAIHKNDGNIAKQAAFDATLVSAVESVFGELLTSVYEDDHARQQRLARLKAVVKTLKSK
jgi:hypothetical protein